MSDRLPIRGRERYSRWSAVPLRSVGCTSDRSTGTVTVLTEPDNGDAARAVLRLTSAAAEDLAGELMRCARWAHPEPVVGEEEAHDCAES